MLTVSKTIRFHSTAEQRNKTRIGFHCIVCLCPTNMNSLRPRDLLLSWPPAKKVKANNTIANDGIAQIERCMRIIVVASFEYDTVQ